MNYEDLPDASHKGLVRIDVLIALFVVSLAVMVMVGAYMYYRPATEVLQTIVGGRK